MHDPIKLDIESTAIVAEIHKNHTGFSNLKDYVKEHFFEFYFGRNAIVIYQDLMADSDTETKRKKLVNWLIKHSNIDAAHHPVARKVLENFKKQIKIKIRQNDIYQNNSTIRISMFDSRCMMIEVQNDTINIVLNYIKTRFLFHLVKFDQENRRLLINVSNEGMPEILKNLLEKRTIAGKKVMFIYEKPYVETILGIRRQESHNDSKARQHGYSNREQFRQSESRRDMDEGARAYLLKVRESYTALGLSRDVTELSKIKKQYYKLAKQYHPDNYYRAGEHLVKLYEERFMKIKDAYETLRGYVEDNQNAA